MSNQTNLGKAVVTGATGGVGSEYALGLARRGYDLLIVGRSESSLQSLASDIMTATGRNVDIQTADLANSTDVDKLVAVLSSDPAITLLANLAGVSKFSAFANIPEDKVGQTIAVNVLALTRLSRAVAPAFVQRGNGTIVNFASVLAFRPWAEFNVYNATKAYVVALSQSLQAEFQEKGVLVQVVAPPATATPFWENAGFSYENLPPQAVMKPSDLVSAALVGLDKRDPWVLPSLADTAVWDAFQESRTNLVKGMMSGAVAARYKTSEVY